MTTALYKVGQQLSTQVAVIVVIRVKIFTDLCANNTDSHSSVAFIDGDFHHLRIRMLRRELNFSDVFTCIAVEPS